MRGKLDNVVLLSIRFDTGGPGSCLKRYSDPTFFRRTSTSGKVSLEKVRSDKKAQKIKVCTENLGVVLCALLE